VNESIIRTIAPLVDAIGGRLVSCDEADDGDLELRSDGEVVAIVRLPDLHGALDRQIAFVEAEMGGSLGGLSFEDKRTAVRLLERRGAFTIRKGAEQIADALNVSRFTIYNYLNASQTANDHEAERT